jgi:hypothetical protein
MKRFLFCFLVLFVLSVGMIFVWFRQNETDDILTSYQRKLPFSNREMTYQSVTRSLSDNGLVFYHPSFPTLPLVMQVERMNLRTLPNETIIRFSGIKLDVEQTLLNRDGDLIVRTLREFEAPYDFLLKPLELLAILNQNIIEGNAEIRIRTVGYNQNLTLLFERKGQEVLKVETLLLGEVNKGLWGFLDGLFQKVQVEITDRQLLNAIAGYYTAIRSQIPSRLKRTLNTGVSFQAEAELSQPWPIAKLFTRF